MVATHLRRDRPHRPLLGVMQPEDRRALLRRQVGNLLHFRYVGATPTGIEAAADRSDVSHLGGVRDGNDATSRPFTGTSRNFAHPVTDAEAEAAIVQAMLEGSGVVAEELALRLRGRRGQRKRGTVVPIRRTAR